jgi:hypothetical protein
MAQRIIEDCLDIFEEHAHFGSRALPLVAVVVFVFLVQIRTSGGHTYPSPLPLSAHSSL